jgi:hypothetical protein
MDDNYDFEDAGKQHAAMSLHSYMKERQEQNAEQLVNYNKVTCIKLISPIILTMPLPVTRDAVYEDRETKRLEDH